MVNNNVKSGLIRIMLADDHAVLRQSLGHILEMQDDFEVVAEASDGNEAVSLATELVPDVIIMDISMPGLNGLEATRRIKASCPSVAVLILTVHNEDGYVHELITAGATGYLLKTVTTSEVIHAIRACVAGETVLSSSISQQLFKPTAAATGSTDYNLADKLTPREKEMLRLLAKGEANKYISHELGLSLNSVKSYLTSIFLKLNVRSRTEAVVVSYRTGILTEHDLK